MRKENRSRQVLALAVTLLVWIGLPRLVQALIIPGVGSGTLVMQMDPASGVSVDGSNNVISWTDQTGTGDGLGGDFSPTSTSSAVTLVSSGLNGLPVIRFNGSGYVQTNFATTSAYATSINSGGGQTNGFTMFVVTNGTTNPLGLFDSAPSASGSFRFFGSDHIDQAGWPSPNAALGATGTVLGFSVENDGPNNRLVWVVNENEKPAPLTTIDLSQTNTPGTGRNSTWATTLPVIGTINLGTAGFYNGDISQILIYNSVLSPTDFSTVQNALIGDFLLTPEPASMSLLVIGGMMLLKRGRRQ